MRTTWRETFAPIIAGILAQHSAHDDRKRARNRARHRQCGGASWLEKVWRDEVAKQLGLKKRLQPGKQPHKPDARQKSFFTDTNEAQP